MALTLQQAKNSSEAQFIARKIGITSIDSDNDLRQIQRVLDAGRAVGVTSFNSDNDWRQAMDYLNSPSPAPASTPAPAPAPPPTPAQSAAPAPAPSSQASPDQSSTADYQNQIAQLTKSYDDKLASTIKTYDSQIASMKDSNTALQGQLGSLQTQLTTANAARDEAKKQADTLLQQYNSEREIAINSQLRGVRSGTTVGGTGGFDEGSTAAGRPAYQSSSDADSLLTDYKKRIISGTATSTSQVSVVPQMQQSSSGGGGGGGSAPAASRAALGSYYARRFR